MAKRNQLTIDFSKVCEELDKLGGDLQQVIDPAFGCGKKG